MFYENIYRKNGGNREYATIKNSGRNIESMVLFRTYDGGDFHIFDLLATTRGHTRTVQKIRNTLLQYIIQYAVYSMRTTCPAILEYTFNVQK